MRGHTPHAQAPWQDRTRGVRGEAVLLKRWTRLPPSFAIPQLWGTSTWCLNLPPMMSWLLTVAPACTFWPGPVPHRPLTRVITPYSLPSIAVLPCAQRYFNEGRPVLLPVPFHREYVLALYFDHGTYRWSSVRRLLKYELFLLNWSQWLAQRWWW